MNTERRVGGPGKFDPDGRHLRAEVSTTHRAWCEGCGWFGPDRQWIRAADADRVQHDLDSVAVHAELSHSVDSLPSTPTAV
jgi:hypothetical protein